LKLKLSLAVLGVAVVVVYGTLAILLIGGPGRDTSSEAGITAKATYPTALEAARAWQDDAQLVSATASWRDLTADQLLERRASWGFTFFSPQTRQMRIISVSKEGTEEVESISVPPTIRTADVESWQIDSPDVLRLFLDGGGRDFMAQYPDGTVSLRLGPQEGGDRLVWMAFGIYSPDRATIALQVDAATGEVISSAR
jgi:hypothetical protein